MSAVTDRLTPAIAALRLLLPGFGDHDRVYRALCRAVADQPVDWADFSDEDWRLAFEMAKSQRVTVRFHRAVTNVSAVPPHIRAGLRASAQMLVAANLALRHEFLRRILPALTAAGIEPLALKGLAMALVWYGVPQDRQMDDIDLLVAPQQQRAAVDVLTALGYEELIDPDAEAAHHVALSGSGAVRLIEIHRTLGGHRSVAVEQLMDWYRGRTLRRAVSMPGIPPQELLVQDAVGAFLFQTAHLLLQHGDGESRINWYLDLHLIVQSGALDWDVLISQSQALGWAGVVLQALEGLTARFGTVVEPDVLQRLAEIPTDQRLQHLLEKKQQPIGSILTFDVRRLANRSWPDRITLAWSLVFPPPAYMRQRYRLTRKRQLPLAYLQRWGRFLIELRNLLLFGRGRRRGK